VSQSRFDASRNVFLSKCTTHVCTIAAGHTFPTTSGNPFNPSQTPAQPAGPGRRSWAVVAKTTQQRRVEDRLWELIEPLIPSRPAPRGPGGRPRIDDRAALEGILFVLDTGCRWRDLPEQLGCGSGHTAWRRLREWQDAGVWDRLHQLVLDELSNIDELDWTRGCIDAVSVRSKRGVS
jgi:transposase